MSRAALKVGNCVIAEKASRQRGESSFSIELQRLREIERVITARHGQIIPETDDADIYLRAAALAATEQDLSAWCARWAPWASAALVATVEIETANRNRMLPADAIAHLLMVTMAERDRLGLRTIGACDLPRDGRLKIARARKQQRDRQRQAAKRAEAQVLDRESYERQSLSRTKPWEAEGVCRRTWERRRAAMSQVPSRVEEDPTGDTLATCRGEERRSGVHLQSHRAPAARVRGSGTMSPAGCQGAEPHGNDDTLTEVAA
ncbi:hypothetical protein [Kaistia sp. UC242_56]|uniref:hypothetical protein n=1 Tax=Kaistia sp. UC242_56 TaxID=3374625 RepID=UPI0037901B97